MSDLRISYSAILSWRACQQQYAYRYVDNLRPKVAAPALTLGTVIHAYFEAYYGSFRSPVKAVAKVSPKVMHRLVSEAEEAILDYNKEIRGMARIAESAGAGDAAKALLDIVPTATVLMRAYHRVHGADDAKRHTPVLVEESFEMDVGDGIMLPGKIDMVTKDKAGYWLWEHKSTGNVPQNARRFRDLQTLIYAAALEELHGIKVAGVIWNYVHTKPPHEPALLQSGVLSQAKDQVTTVELYRQAIKRYGLDGDTYEPFLRVVECREHQTMFPRITMPIMQAEHVLLRDYVASVREIKRFVKYGRTPIRNVAMGCDWCSYVDLCSAVIAGGDETYIKHQKFTTEREARHGKKR